MPFHRKYSNEDRMAQWNSPFSMESRWAADTSTNGYHRGMGFVEWCLKCRRYSSMWIPRGRSDPKPSIQISILEQSEKWKWNRIIGVLPGLGVLKSETGIWMWISLLTSLSLSASLICWAMKRTPRRACSTSGVNCLGNVTSGSRAIEK